MRLTLALARLVAGAVRIALRAAVVTAVWAATAVAAPPPDALGVSVRDGRVTLDVSRRPLGEVLGTLARALPMTVTARNARLDERISVSMTDVDVEQALRRLLAGRSYVLIHAGDPAPRLVEVVILRDPRPEPARPAEPVADGTGAGRDASAGAGGDDLSPPVPHVAPATPFEGLSLDALTVIAVRGPDAAERADALEAVAYAAPAVEAREAHAAEVLAVALVDPDESVRARALETIKDTQDEVPVTALARMASADRSPERRAQALALLAERAEAAAVGPLRTALSDPDASVRERARELLDDLHQPAEPSPARSRTRGGSPPRRR